MHQTTVSLRSICPIYFVARTVICYYQDVAFSNERDHKTSSVSVVKLCKSRSNACNQALGGRSIEMMARGKEVPNKNIGEFLKARRERLNESLAEVSGAVEIDIDYLQRIEVGTELPSEDILILLMSHFSVDESEARNLLRLAGYSNPDDANLVDEQIAKQIFMLMPMMIPVLMADDVVVTPGTSTVTLAFSQPGNSTPVAKVGLSKDQAARLLRQLHECLNHSPKLLNAPKQIKKQA